MKRLRVRSGGPDTADSAPVLLVLPTDQVLYRELSGTDAGPDGAAHVRAALEGQTPYPVSELRFAFERLEGGGISYAAVALETLEEAEQFARDNGFEPKGVLAAPKDGVFPAPAWFGGLQTSVEQGWLPRPQEVSWAVAPAGVTIERSVNPVQVAASRARAHSAARQAPPLGEASLTEDLTPSEEHRLNRLIAGPSLWERFGRNTLKLGGLTAGLLTVIAIGIMVLERTPVPEAGPDPAEISAEPPLARPLALAPVETAEADLPGAEELEYPTGLEESDLWTPERGLMRRADTDNLDTLVQPALDPPVGGDALALDLPDPETSVPLLTVLTPPPAPEQRFELDPDGLVLPTPDGAPTPEGYRVFTGPPPALPPLRTERLVEAQREADALAEATPPDALDAATAPVMPRQRPAGLFARFERNSLGGRTRTELATLRPTPRQPDLATAAATRAAIESAAVEAAVASAQETASLRPSSTDPRPAVRPAGLRTAAAPAASNSQREAVAAVAAASTAAVAKPAEPSRQELAATYVEPTRASPKSVERQATSGRMDLRRVNLLGTFGPSSAQRALVRLPSGKVVNVKVGDRFDGGRVSSIGRGELRYSKGGQSVTLKMPRG